MTDEVLDAEVVEEPTMELAPRPAPVLAVTPQVEAKELVERLDTIREAMDNAMTPDVDYGVIPGTNKPALLKPGAEKLAVLFQLDVQLQNEKTFDGNHLTVFSLATVFHAPTGSRLGFGEGLCTTREKKYAYRQQERTCPTCGAASVIKGKAEYGGGWLCWKKRDGCGAKFDANAPEIVSQEVGQVENPDLPDLWNTVVKMAEKRARVDAVLAVTGASALFTQDVEGEPVSEPPPAAEDAPIPFDPPPDAIISKTDVAGLFKAIQGNPAKPAELKAQLVRIGVPEEDIKSVRQALGLLTVKQAGELFMWLEQQKSDLPADTEGLADA